MFCRALIISLNDLTFDSFSRAFESSVHVVMCGCLSGLRIDCFAFCFSIGCRSGVYPCFTGVRSNRLLLSDSVISSCVFTTFVIESCTKVTGTKSVSSLLLNQRGGLLVRSLCVILNTTVRYKGYWYS